MNKKINDMFNRKEDKKTQQPKVKRVYFNESYIDCELIYHPHQLSLIKVQANISVGPEAGMPIITQCKWFLKFNNKYHEINGVKGTCYQPCIDDVGKQICVQIDPQIEGKTYSGATIMKQTQPLQLGANLESEHTEVKKKLYHFNQPQQYKIRLQNIQHTSLQLPIDGNIIVFRKNQAQELFLIRVEAETYRQEHIISQQYPQIQFIRNSYNTINVQWSENNQLRCSFETTMERDIFSLLTRTLSATSVFIPSQLQPAQQPTIQPITQPQQQPQSQHKHLIQKYNAEKQIRIKLEGALENYNKDKKQLEVYKREATKLKQQNSQLTNDNRFYLNELTILKKELKSQQQITEQLNKTINEKDAALAKSITTQPDKDLSSMSAVYECQKQRRIREQAEETNEKLKNTIEQLENQLTKTKKSLASLAQAKIKVTEPSQPITPPEPPKIDERDKLIEDMEFKITHLQALLKHKKTEPGNEYLHFKEIVNKLTETLTEKEEEIKSLKKINKQLMEMSKQ